MLPRDRRVDLLEGELQRVRRELEAEVAAMPATSVHRAPEGQWTPAQLIWHLAKVERSVARLVERKDAEIGPMATVPPGPAPDRVLQLLDHIPWADRSRRIMAPENIRPPQEVDFVAERGRWADGRVQLLEAAHACGPRLSLVRHPHPIFGDFDGWQWVLMVARHEQRHLLQLRETLASRG